MNTLTLPVAASRATATTIDAPFLSVEFRTLDAWVLGEITRREAIEELMHLGAPARVAIRTIRQIEKCGWEV